MKKSTSSLNKRNVLVAVAFLFTIGLVSEASVMAQTPPLIISEFRYNGNGGTNDEFIEVYNNSDSDVLVGALDASAGYALVTSDGTVRFVIPNGTTVRARGHYLVVNSLGYSLGTYPAGDGTFAVADGSYASDIPINMGIALFNNATPANFTLANRLDAVGTASEANPLYKEGPGITDLTASLVTFNVNYSLFRYLGSGSAKDTQDNRQDFIFTDTNGTCGFVGGCTFGTPEAQRLGGAGPENTLSPVVPGIAQFPNFIFDSSQPNGSPPNLVRDPTTSNPNGTFGTLDIRRRFTNNTGVNLTRLRFRIVNLTTFNNAPGDAWLSARSSGDLVVGGVNDAATCGVSPTPCSVTVRGTTLEDTNPGSYPNGGGYNSTFSAGSVNGGTPLAPGASISVRFLFGVEANGTFRFQIVPEILPATPSGPPATWGLTGPTSGAGPTVTNGVVTGRITGDDALPVAGTVVRLSGTQNRKTITDAQGRYRFDSVETSGFYTVTPERPNFTFTPARRSFSQLGERTDAAFTGNTDGSVVNPLDTAEFFVRQQYVDLLDREPDEGGFNYWSDRILECGGDARCASSRRRDVAAAFFIEAEFQQTGSFVYGLYKGSLGRRPVYSEYSADRQQLGTGASLEFQKQALTQNFVSRAEFVAKYQSNTSAESFVDALLGSVQQSSGLDLSSRRGSLISRYNAGVNVTQSRGLVLRELIEEPAFKQAEYNSAFVVTEYFGYLRRDPELGGYNFWLEVLNNREAGNYRGMVCAFITSAEYQQRFSSIVTRNDQECAQ